MKKNKTLTTEKLKLKQKQENMKKMTTSKIIKFTK